MAEDPKPFPVIKVALLIGIGFAIVWMVMPPSKIADHAFQDVQEQSVTQSDSMEVFLGDLSSELNASLPRRVSEDARLDTTMAGPGNRFSYFYTLLSVTADEVSESMFENEMAPMMKRRGINSGYLDDFFRDGTVVEFRYADLEGNPIGSFVITPEDAGY